MRSNLRPSCLTFESVTRHTIYLQFAPRKNSELRIHFVFPCNVTLKIEFSRKKISLDNGKNLASLICLPKLIPISQLNYSIL